MSSKRKIFCCFPPSDQHKGSPCVDLGLIYPRRHSCDLWGQSVTEQTRTDRNRKRCYCKRWEYPNCEKVQLTTTWIVCCWGVKTKMSECISKEKKKEKRENKEQGETKAIKQNIIGIWWHATATEMHQWWKTTAGYHSLSGSTAR